MPSPRFSASQIGGAEVSWETSGTINLGPCALAAPFLFYSATREGAHGQEVAGAPRSGYVEAEESVHGPTRRSQTNRRIIGRTEVVAPIFF